MLFIKYISKMVYVLSTMLMAALKTLCELNGVVHSCDFSKNSQGPRFHIIQLRLYIT